MGTERRGEVGNKERVGVKTEQEPESKGRRRRKLGEGEEKASESDERRKWE